MSNIEKVEVSIDRVIVYLDCGCIKKSEITLDAKRLAELKRSVKKEHCPKHDHFESRQIYYCQECRTVDCIQAQHDDTAQSASDKIHAIHYIEHPSCTYPKIYLIRLAKNPSRERIEASSEFPQWAKQPILKMLGIERTINQ